MILRPWLQMTAYLASHLVTLVMIVVSLITANAATTASRENRVQVENIDQDHYMVKGRDDRVDILQLVCLCMRGVGLGLRRTRRGAREVLLVLHSEADR
jgi:hypothetical protein